MLAQVKASIPLEELCGKALLTQRRLFFQELVKGHRNLQAGHLHDRAGHIRQHRPLLCGAQEERAAQEVQQAETKARSSHPSLHSAA